MIVMFWIPENDNGPPQEKTIPMPPVERRLVLGIACHLCIDSIKKRMKGAEAQVAAIGNNVLFSKINQLSLNI